MRLYYISMILTVQVWKVYLQEQKETCRIDLPMKSGIESNVRMAYKANNLDVCKRKASSLASSDSNTIPQHF